MTGRLIRMGLTEGATAGTGAGTNVGKGTGARGTGGNAGPDSAPEPRPPIVLRTPPNWTAVTFFAALGLLHLSIALPAFCHGRVEGYMSCGFAAVFLMVSGVAYLVNVELAFLPAERRIRIRSGYGRMHYERSVPFGLVRAVRVTLGVTGAGPAAGRVDVVCRDEDLECPPAPLACQQALGLALAMGVRLIKVMRDEPARPHRLDDRANEPRCD